MPSTSPRTPPPVYHDGQLRIIFAVTLISVMSISSVTPAFPGVVRALGISVAEVGLLVTVYSIPGIFLTPFLGVLADRVGRKRVLLPSLLLFSLAGASCALARDFNLLLGLRFLQGLGSAPLIALCVTIISDRFDGRRRTQAIGLNASVLNIGTATYPSLGGALALLAWYYPFALPALALPVVLLVWRRLDVDGSGAAKQSVPRYLVSVRGGLRDRRVIGLLIAGGGVFLFLFGSYLTYLPELAEQQHGAGAFTAGILISLSSVTTGLTSTQLGPLSERFGLRRLILTSFVIDGVALALMPLAPTVWTLGACSLLFGVAQGINLPAIQTRLTEIVPADSRAAFLSLNTVALKVGQTIGPLLMGVVIASLSTAAVFYMGALCALGMLILSAWLL